MQLAGRFDTARGDLTSIGGVGIFPTNGDLTSNGDGSLYFAQNEAGHTLHRLDPTTGETISSAVTVPGVVGTQALAFWGGLFYVFVGDSIYAYDRESDTTEALGAAPLTITGAGQSTCVPKVQPPK